MFNHKLCTMKRTIFILLCGCFFFTSPKISAQSNDRTFSSHFHSSEWSGTDIKGISNAKFKDFNGKEKIKYEVKKDETFKFKYSVDITKGAFLIEIKSTNNGVIHNKQIKAVKSELLTFKMEENDVFVITLTGTRASGNFDILYGDKIND